jgi:hypothetical protein
VGENKKAISVSNRLHNDCIALQSAPSWYFCISVSVYFSLERKRRLNICQRRSRRSTKSLRGSRTRAALHGRQIGNRFSSAFLTHHVTSTKLDHETGGQLKYLNHPPQLLDAMSADSLKNSPPSRASADKIKFQDFAIKGFECIFA